MYWFSVSLTGGILRVQCFSNFFFTPGKGLIGGFTAVSIAPARGFDPIGFDAITAHSGLRPSDFFETTANQRPILVARNPSVFVNRVAATTGLSDLQAVVATCAIVGIFESPYLIRSSGRLVETAALAAPELRSLAF